jgi:hypothetical protein
MEIINVIAAVQAAFMKGLLTQAAASLWPGLSYFSLSG